MPRLVSVQVALPGPFLEREGRPVVTAIGKRRVEGTVEVLPLGLAGDGVGDPRVHGGPRKSVYAYPTEHYAFWRRERPEMALSFGVFGENLSLEGLTEADVRPGDRLEIGTARFVVTQPRSPCATLALRFGRPTFVREFYAAGRSGFYLGVERVGTLRAGDPVHLERTGDDGPTIAELYGRNRSEFLAEAVRSGGAP